VPTGDEVSQRNAEISNLISIASSDGHKSNLQLERCCIMNEKLMSFEVKWHLRSCTCSTESKAMVIVTEISSFATNAS